MNHSRPINDFTPIESLAMEGVVTQALLQSVRMGLFDALETMHSPEALAAGLDLVPEALNALLELLRSRGLTTRNSEGWANTPMSSEFLVSDSPFFQGHALNVHETFNQYVSANMDSLLRGQADARETADATWASPETLEGMARHALLGSLQDTVAFASELPGFADMRTMCDIGGNHGRYTMHLIDRNPSLRGTIADLPSVTPAVQTACNEAGYGDRITTLACDLRTDSLPNGAYDLILASDILYGFEDNLVDILTMIRNSLVPGGWFVSHHYDPDSPGIDQYKATLQLVTRLSGYATHFLSRDTLENALSGSGFSEFRACSTGSAGHGLALAARAI